MLSLVVAWVVSMDGGVAVKSDAAVAQRELSAEDLEVVKELELLENLDSSIELELLQELSLDR